MNVSELIKKNPAYRLRGSSVLNTVIFVAGEIHTVNHQNYSPEFIKLAKNLPVVEESKDFEKTGKVNYHPQAHWSHNGWVYLEDVEYVHKETGKKIWSINNVQQ